MNFAVQGIVAGAYDLAIACGVESMSQTPIPPSFKPDGPTGPQYSEREIARYNGRLVAQGPASDLMNDRFGITRSDLDAFSARSHARASEATRGGRFREQMVAMTVDPHDPASPGIESDEGIRDQIDLQKMAQLAPAFRVDGATTAANASQLSDGAAALLISSRDYADRHGLAPRARFRALSVAAADPVIQFTAILDATRKALAQSGLEIGDIDYFEVNEAFAGVPLIFQREFGIDDAQLNVNGGSVAIGHPLGSTGARMLTDLLCHLEHTGKRLGLQTICEAAGTANTTIIETL